MGRILGTTLVVTLVVGLAVASDDPLADPERAEIAALVTTWQGAPDIGFLERVLGDDFVRPMQSGKFWSKADQIEWLRERPPSPGFRTEIGDLRIRRVDGTLIATGTATLFDPRGVAVDRNVFTDVLAKRDGSWRIVSSQKTQVANR